jgi:RNA polymerase sigma-70 factor (ECF subfamily)
MSQANLPTDIRRDLVALLPRLRRFALTLTSNPSEADQLVRDIANRAIQTSHHWKGEGRLENWLFSMMRGAWADDAKKRRRAEAAQATGETPQMPGNQQIPLMSLEEGQASAFLLCDVEGFTYTEAASILGIPADLFAARLCAARLRLAEIGSETSERRA